MWSFGKKKFKSVDLPPFPRPDDEITLLPEGEAIPEELPSLVMENSSEEIVMEESSNPVIQQSANLTPRGINGRFISATRYKGMQSEIFNLDNRFGNIGDDIKNVVRIKQQRDNKIDDLQNNLDEISKRLMSVEKTLFGG